MRNRPDGSVEVVAEGPKAELENLVAWCRRGPPRAQVDRVEVEWGEATGEFWSTYDCPAEDAPEVGGGYVFPNGAVMTNFGPPPPACTYEGRGGRHGGKTACYISDLIPTTLHLDVTWVMAYDLFPLETIENRKRYYSHAIPERWITIFTHDPEIPWVIPALEGSKIVARPV